MEDELPTVLHWRDATDQLVFSKMKLRDLPEFSHAKWVFFPDDMFINIWQSLISLLLLYTATVTIYCISFVEDESEGWPISGTVIDSIFCYWRVNKLPTGLLRH